MESHIRKEYELLCPPELQEGTPDMRTTEGRAERDKRIGRYVVAQDILKDVATPDKILQIARDDNPYYGNFYRQVLKAWADRWPGHPASGLCAGDVEIAVMDWGVEEDVGLHNCRVLSI